MIYIFSDITDEGKSVVAVATVEPVEGEDNAAEFTINEEEEGSLLAMLGKSSYYILIAKGISEDGKFDPSRLDHWDALPDIFRGGRFVVEDMTDEEAAEYAKQLGGFEEGDSEKGA